MNTDTTVISHLAPPDFVARGADNTALRVGDLVQRVRPYEEHYLRIERFRIREGAPITADLTRTTTWKSVYTWEYALNLKPESR